MSMVEDVLGSIKWECSNCKSVLRNKNDFESKVKSCHKCKEKVTAFYSLFDEDGNYIK